MPKIQVTIIYNMEAQNYQFFLAILTKLCVKDRRP